MLKLIEVFKIYTNVYAEMGKVETLCQLWPFIKKIIANSEEQAAIALKSLAYCKEQYQVADPLAAFKNKTTFKLKEGDGTLLLKYSQRSSWRTCYNLKKVPKSALAGW